MRILITGGAGYKGSIISERLANQGHKIKIVDTMWFGNNLKKNKNINIIKKDIRELKKKDFKGINSVIHLANIANDPSVKINPLLSWEINVLETERLINLCIMNKVKKFIYASSGSVYGVKKEKKVTEKSSLVPISYYNKTKMISERVLLSYKNKIKVICIRPATVCGISPRMRLDTTVNMLTYQAIKNGQITILGGKQIRPNVNIIDMSRIYEYFINNNKLNEGIYNAGFENLSINQIAKKIAKKTKAKILYKKNNDVRSYRLDSSKLLRTGFKTINSVDKTIDDLIIYFSQNKIDKSKCENINWMKKNINYGKIS